MMESKYAGEDSRARMKIEYINMAREAFAEAKAEIAIEVKKMKDSVAYPSASDQDVRMQCVSLIIGRATGDMTDGAIVAAADTLAQYVLTGQKPGEA